MVGGTARTLASQSARAAGAGERGESTERWYHGGGTGNLWEQQGREIEHRRGARRGGYAYLRRMVRSTWGRVLIGSR